MAYYFYVDTFFPKPFFSGVPHPDNNVYLLIMAAIVDDNPTDGTQGFTALANYINQAGVPSGGYVFRYLPDDWDSSLKAKLGGGTPTNTYLVPVPFPQGTQISVSFNGFALPAASVGYAFKDNLEKMNWVYRNNSWVELDPAKYPGSMSADQLATLNDFVLSLLYKIANNKNPDGSPAGTFAPGSCGALIQGMSWLPAGMDKKILNTWLTQPRSGPANCPVSVHDLSLAYVQLYSTKIINGGCSFDPKDDNSKRLIPPPFKFSLEQLAALAKANPAALSALLGTDLHYLNAVWSQFQEGYKQDKQSTPGQENAKLADRLRLFYGAGERLRIPAIPAAPGNLRFMQVMDDISPDGSDGGWVVSNNYSLAGHVVAIPSALFATPGWQTGFQIGINGNVVAMPNLSDLASQLSSVATKFVNGYQRSDFPQTTSVLTQAPIPDRKGKPVVAGQARYYPANAVVGDKSDDFITVQPTAQGDPAIDLLKVPDHLLDELDPNARVSYTPPEGSTKSAFLYLTPQRTSLTYNELFQNGNFAPGVYSKPSDCTAAIRIPVRLKQVILPSTDDGKLLFKIYCSLNGMHATDIANLRQVFPPTGPASQKLLLLYPVNTASGSVVKYLPLTAIQPSPMLTGSDELLAFYSSQAELLPLLGVPSGGGSSSAGAKTVAMDLLVPNAKLSTPAGAPPNYVFNKLIRTAAQKEVFLALGNILKFKFNRSVNSFAALLGVSLSVTQRLVKAADQKTVPLMINHYRNFKKLRVNLVNAGTTLAINNADALLPACSQKLDPTASDPTPVLSSYYSLTHAFSNETNDDPDDGESNRFLLYKNGGAVYALQGCIENQYAYRIQEQTQAVIPMGYSQPLRNIAETVIQVQKTDTNPTDTVPDTFPLLVYSINGNSLVITLNPECITQMINPPGATDQNTGTKAYRTLYETFFDVLNNDCKLYVETWIFDNAINVVNAEISAHPDLSGKLPNILNSLRPSPANSFELPFDKASLLGWAIGGKDYSDFKTALNKISKITPVVEPILPGNQATIAGADLIRVSLTITRKPEKTVAMLFSGGIAATDLLPLPMTDAVGKPIPNSALDNPQQAQTNLTAYIANDPNNRLFTSRAYLYSEQYNVLRTAVNAPNSKRNNIRELLGELSRYTWIPDTASHPVTDTQLYYVPYAFLPLRANSQMGSISATTDFAEWLVRILSWMSYPEDFTGNIGDFVQIDTSRLTPAQLLQLKKGARTLLQGNAVGGTASLARKMAGLLAWVDNRDAIEDKKFPPLVDVKAITSDISPTDLAKPQPLLDAFTSLLIANPLVFVTAKGIGTGLFASYSASNNSLPGRMSDLYSLQLIKDIKNVFDAPIQGTAPAAAYTISQLNFHNFLTCAAKNRRFFLEVLDDTLFEDQFKISEAGCDNEIKGAPSGNLNPNATQGRTADDVLRDQNPFNQKDADGGVRATVVTKHFNPDWNTNVSGKQVLYYLLPSRQAPGIPVPVTRVFYTDAMGNLQALPIMISKSFGGDEWQNVLNFGRSGSAANTLKVSLSSTGGKSSLLSFTRRSTTPNNGMFTTDWFPQINVPGGADTIPDWSRLDAYANTYYFIVEGDEEGSLDNDMIEVYVTSAIGVTAAGATKAAPGMAAAAYTFPPPWLENFDYYSHKQEYINTNTPAPGKITLATSQDITDTLNVLGNSLTSLLQANDRPVYDPDDAITFLFNPGGDPYRTGGNDTGPAHGRLFAPKSPTGLGQVLCTQVYQQDQVANATSKAAKYLIRVIILSDVWSHFKCRMRVKRNWRDLNDKIPAGGLSPLNDLNPGFMMNSDYSQWLDHGIDELTYDYLVNPQIKPTYLRYLPCSSLSIDDYMNNPGGRKMGRLISQTIAQAGKLLAQANLMGPAGYAFKAQVYDRVGNSLLGQYPGGKTNADILAINSAYSDRADRVSYSGSGPDGQTVDDIVNPLSPAVVSYAPFIWMTWYSKEDRNAPVFSINWQVKFSEFN